MKPLGLLGLKKSLYSANGPAQHLLLGVWGLIVTAGFYKVGIPAYFLITWALVSLSVIYCTIWARKVVLLNFLKLDTMLTIMVLCLYLYEEYATGITTPVFFAGRVIAGTVLSLHGFYLIDLVQRQIHEALYVEERLKNES